MKIRIGMFAAAALALFLVVVWPVNAANAQAYWRYGVGNRVWAYTEAGQGWQWNGHPTDRLPHNLNLYIKGVENKALINHTRSELAISAGAACTTTAVEPSHVIIALGFPEERAYCSIRIGLGRHNTEDEVKYASGAIVSAVNKLKKIKSVA